MSAKSKVRLDQKQLAKYLGISQMTISRVMNNQPGVSKKMREKVLQAVEKFDYVHDHVAVGLRTKTTHVIGLVIPDVSDSFFPDITMSIEKTANQQEYRVILAHSFESYEEECKQINVLLGFRVSGLIIAPAGRQKEVDIYDKLQRLKVPFVFIDRIKKNVNCSSVVTDTFSGAAELGKYLANKGYKRWGYLHGPQSVSSSMEHFRGIRKSYREAGLTNGNLVSIQAGFSEEDGYRGTEKLLATYDPDIIIAVNDPVATGAYRYLKEKEILIPQKIGLAGFSDLHYSDLLEVPLTTMREKTELIGKEAVRLLLDEINNKDLKKQRLRLTTQLMVRDSA
jgi:LacI family transcriptional regulator